jgi:hypothetical protein
MVRTPAVQRGRSRWIWVILGAIIILPIAWYLGSPLFITRTVNEPFPMSATATVPQGMTRQQVEDEMKKAADQTVNASDAMPAAGEVRALAKGDFVSADGVHKGKGTATAYRVGQELIVRLDPFESTNGPALHVYLSGHAAPKNGGQLNESGALDLGNLKGNVGAQNYTLPAGTDLSKFKSVVIYCQRFHVVFSSATLAQAQ